MGKGSGVFDGCIQTLLFVCFAVYGLMGLGLVVMGAIYWGESGAVSTTAMSLFSLGVVMLIVTGISMYANNAESWTMMLIVQVINVGLFFWLTGMMVVCFMFALGYQDPAADLVRRDWKFMFMNEAKDYNKGASGASSGLAVKSVCFEYVGACKAYGSSYDVVVQDIGHTSSTHCMGTLKKNGTVQLTFTKANSQAHFNSASQKCSYFTDVSSQCGALSLSCAGCSIACQNYWISETRAGSETAAVFVMFLVVCVAATVTFNGIIGLDDDGELGGIKLQISVALNAITPILGFAMIVLVAIRLCTSSGYTSLLVVCLLLGILLFGFGGACLFGILKGNQFLIDLCSAFLTIFGYVLLVVGIALAVCTGAVMGDAQAQYDQNYPQMRAAVEAADATFCQIPTAQCKALMQKTSPSSVDKAFDGGAHDPNALWDTQFLAIQTESSARNNPCYERCKSTAVCVACHDVFQGVDKKKTGFYQNMDGSNATNKNYMKYYAGVGNTGGNTAAGWTALLKSWGTNKGAATSHNATRVAAWAKDLYNWTAYSPNGRKTSLKLGRCETVLGKVASDSSLCDQNRDNDADCLHCEFVRFADPTGSATEEKERCLRYLHAKIGTFGTSCHSGSAKTKCRALFRDGVTKATVDSAGKGCKTTQTPCKKASDVCVSKEQVFKEFNLPKIGLCQFTDTSCKLKLTWYTEDKMSVLMVFGMIFTVVFGAILYLSTRGIIVYKGGGDDE